MLKATSINSQKQGQPAPGGLNWWVFFWASVVFIVYGSLFPFDFQSEAKPIEEFYAAWQMFRNIPDASDNVLLFIPLGIGLDACFRGRSRLFWASVTAWLVLGVGIQLVQLYLPTRTAAVSDALWNAVGMVAGMLAFKRLRLTIDQLTRSSTGRQDSYAMLLVVIWFCYESYPFVPTLDVGELRDHIKSVFVAPPFEMMRLVQHTLAAALAAVAMMRSSWLQPRWLNVLIPGSLAVFLEVFVAYGSLRQEALTGIIAGLFLGYWMAAYKPQKTPMLAMIFALIALLITVLTPYRGQAQGSTFTFTPFAGIFWKGVTVDVSPSAFEALSIGILFWSGSLLKGTSRAPRMAWFGAICILLMMLEFFRMYVVGYNGDSTPLVMALILASFPQSTSKDKPGVAMLPEDRPHREPAALTQGLNLAPSHAHLISVTILALFIAVLFHLPGLPYNVRALMGPGVAGFVSVLCVAITAYGMANGGFLLFVSSQRKWPILFPAVLVAQGMFTWWLLRYSVPTKSLFDIVGTPILGWPWELEPLARYTVLHLVVMLQLLGAELCVLTVLQPSRLPGFLIWALISALSAWPAYLIIVQGATTDNLTELMSGDASFYAASALAGAIFLTCLASSALSASFSSSGSLWRLVGLALVSLLGASLLFWLGAEKNIFKYGKMFSAFQFLLSSDRQHYAQGAALTLRYVLAILSITIGLAVMQWSSWLWLLRTLPPREMRLT
jgi:VanZ family protein